MPATDQQADLETIVAVVARSQIVVAGLNGRIERSLGVRNMPAGFEETDIAILDWIAAETGRVGRSYLPI